MTLTERDRRIVVILIPIVILVAYWFLLLAPKRSDLSDARSARDQAQQARDAAVSQANQLEHARQTYAADYAAIVRLGKAIPASIDAPSLLVQLDRAAKGTHIDFDSVTFGARTQAAAPVATPETQPPAQPAGNAAAGGAPAASAPGTAVESAGNAVNQSNQASAAAAGTTGATGPTGTETPAPASTAPPPTLDTVPLTFNFRGTYFDLADFFHRIKRYVYVTGNRIFVRGRLMTIDTLAFSLGETTGGGNELTANVGATIYLSPKVTGVTGGATEAGPGGTATTPSGAQTSALPLATGGVR